MKIVEKRKIFYAISLSVIVLGLIFMAYNKFIAKNDFFDLGVEFKGGTVLTVNLGDKVTVDEEEVKDLVHKVTNDKNAQIQKVAGKNEVIVKLADKNNDADNKEENNEENKEVADAFDSVEEEVTANIETIGEMPNQDSAIITKSNDEVVREVKTEVASNADSVELVLKAFEIKYGTNDESIVELEDFDATMGREMTNNAIVSVILACIAILVYISFRFKDPKMGLAAICALCHDVLIVLAFCAIFRVSIGTSFIAAILTIVGYSINNTIVIFDRIRENARGTARAHKNTLINKSVAETMTRTINTSVTTILSVLTLYILGVDSIKEFILPLLVGLVAGTWSSVVIAGPVWFDFYYFKKKKPMHEETKVEDKKVEAKVDTKVEVKEEVKEEKETKVEAKKEAKKATSNSKNTKKTDVKKTAKRASK